MCMCVVFYMPTHTGVLYICMCSQDAPPPGLRAVGRRHAPAHIGAREHSHACTLPRTGGGHVL